MSSVYTALVQSTGYYSLPAQLDSRAGLPQSAEQNQIGDAMTVTLSAEGQAASILVTVFLTDYRNVTCLVLYC
ncbi:MAG: hypothetical protein LBT89_10865 [Planctomycetaceae bacterium]|jgi:hypothetical protein|nr:hypothetical protein [Planctomycetaceae bacterium]